MYCIGMHSLWASSPRESLQLHLWNLNICMEKVNAKCWLAEMILVMMSLPLVGAFTFFFKVCYIPTRFRFMLIGRSLTAQSTESHRGIRGGNWKKDLRLGHSQVPKTDTKYKIFLVNIISPACVRIKFHFFIILVSTQRCGATWQWPAMSSTTRSASCII